MIFQSSQFFFLFVATLLAYSIARTSKLRLIILLSASLIYVFYSGFRDGVIVVGLIATNLIVLNGFRKMGFARPGRPRFLLLVTAIILNLAPLLYFKYSRFFVTEILNIYNQPIIFLPAGNQPLGLSFLTFVLIAYQVDAYRRTIPVESNWLIFGAFASFFPSFSAGPIMRGGQLIPQLRSLARPNYDNLKIGFFYILLGMTKKILFADYVSPMVDSWFSASQLGPLSFFDAWSAAVGFGLQIYCDFSGYSDIAVGLARCFGIKLKINFKQPYLSSNPSMFWRRWHITLSEWLRDYIYIPMGGSLAGTMKTVLNLLITMLICGFWHGANWTFIIWGLMHGVYLVVNRLIRPYAGSFPRIGIFVNFIIVMIAWVFFRSEDLPQAIGIIKTMLWPVSLGSTSAGMTCIGLIVLSLGLQWTEARLLDAKSRMVIWWHHLPPALKGLLAALHITILVVCLHKEILFIYFRF